MSRRAPGLSTRRPPPEPPFPRVPSRALTPCDPRRLPPTSARSTRPPPFRRDERTSNAGPPPVLGLCRPSIRLPTLFRRLAPERRWLDRGRYRALFTPGRSWPRAARRLLQSKRSASTTCGPRNPVTLIGRSACAELLILRDRSSFRLGHRRFDTTMIQSKGSRGFTGQGPWLHCNR